MYYVGVDLHKKQSWFYVIDEVGKKIDSKSISNRPKELKGYFDTIPKPFILAVETTYNWYFFVDIAEQYADKVYLANSCSLKAFAKQHKKTDKIDAYLIADILRKGYLPTVTIPDKETRQMKEFLRYRMNIVTDRTRNICRLKNLLDKIGQESSGDFTTYKKLDKLSVNHLPENYQEVINGYRNRITNLTKEYYEIETLLEKKVSNDEDMLRLLSIPGIGYFSAALIKSEIISINRFASFNRLCSYAGLAPRVSQSGDRLFHGSLNKNRRKALQWILIEITHHFLKVMPEYAKKHARMVRQKGKNTAKVNFARYILKIIYHVLKEKRLFYIKRLNVHKIQSVAAPALQRV